MRHILIFDFKDKFVLQKQGMEPIDFINKVQAELQAVDNRGGMELPLVVVFDSDKQLFMNSEIESFGESV